MHHPRAALTLGITFATALLVVPFAEPAPAAAAKAGQTCKRVGSRVGALICTKVGSRLVYKTAGTATSAPVTTAASTAAEPATTAAGATTAPKITTPAPKGASLTKATLGEWDITTPNLFKAGTVAFDVSNVGEFPHDFVVAQGISYADLPKLPSGAVDESKVKILGRTARLQPKEAAKLEVNLTPGGYVFYCSVIFGPTNHAERGQVLSVTVQ